MKSCCCSWPSPSLVLIVACTAAFLLLLDRGVISSNGIGGSTASPGTTTITVEFSLSLFQSGCIPAVYFVGLSLGAPILGLLTSSFKPFRLIAVFFVIWGIGEVLTGASQSYAMLLVFRFVVGFGSAPIIVLPVLIDDIAPPKYKTTWISIFFVFVPVAIALGYIVGGAIGASLGWRVIFYILGGISLPVIAFFSLAPPLQHTASAAVSIQNNKLKYEMNNDNNTISTTTSIPSIQTIDNNNNNNTMTSTTPLTTTVHDNNTHHSNNNQILQQSNKPCRRQPIALLYHKTTDALSNCIHHFKMLFQHKVCVFVILSMALWNCYVSTLSWWGPKSTLTRFYDTSTDGETVDFIFGAVAAATGVFGSLLGGGMLDLLGNRLSTAVQQNAVVTLLYAILGVVFSIVSNVSAYWVVLAIVEVLAFSVQAPGYASIMWSVPSHLRPFAMAIVEVAQHIFGDIPGPPIMGAIQSDTDNWSLTLALLSIAPLLGGIGFCIAALFARRAIDYRDDDGGGGGGDSNKE